MLIHVMIGFTLIATPVLGASNDVLADAKELYLSAAYEDALTALTHVDESDPAAVRVADQFRVSCLYALGRQAEAEQVAELLIEREPMMQLEDTSPRIDAMFQDVRRRLLPRLIRTEYKAAKSAIDEKAAARAKVHLVAARTMLDEANKIGAHDDGLGDLAILVDGFMSLTDAAVVDARAATPASAEAATTPAKVAAPTPAKAPARTPAKVSVAPTPANLSDERPRADGPAALYGIEDQGVTPPSIVLQRIPALPNDLSRFVPKRPARGVLELVIGEHGEVEESTIKQSLHPVYDALVLERSRGWRYTPATKDGVPVKFRRTIIITLN